MVARHRAERNNRSNSNSEPYNNHHLHDNRNNKRMHQHRIGYSYGYTFTGSFGNACNYSYLLGKQHYSYCQRCNHLHMGARYRIERNNRSIGNSIANCNYHLHSNRNDQRVRNNINRYIGCNCKPTA